MSGQYPQFNGTGNEVTPATLPSLEVTDGVHNETGITEINFTSGATVSSGGAGVADVAISGGGGGTITVEDGTNTETGISTLLLTSPGLTVSSPTSGEAQATITSKEAVNTVATGGSSQTIPDPWGTGLETITDLTLTAATCTLTFPTAAAGKSFTIIARQDATGGRLLAYPGSGAIVWMSGGGAPVLSTAANAVDILTFICTDGTHWLGAFTPGYSSPTADDEWQADINTYRIAPSATVGTWALNFWSGFDNGGYGINNSSAAQNDAIAWKVPLSAGTWTIRLSVRESSNTAIATVEIDGSSVGTLDTYAASGTQGILALSGVTIGSSGVHEVRLVAATKNASSTGYLLELFGIGLGRTA